MKSYNSYFESIVPEIKFNCHLLALPKYGLQDLYYFILNLLIYIANYAPNFIAVWKKLFWKFFYNQLDLDISRIRLTIHVTLFC